MVHVLINAYHVQCDRTVANKAEVYFVYVVNLPYKNVNGKK